MGIDEAIRTFADYLNNSWETAFRLLVNRNYTSNEDSINDWFQANWELLVERKVLEINEYLEVYGDGADYNGASSRIANPDALPGFKVIVKAQNSDGVFDLLNNQHIKFENAIFDKVVGFKNGFYVIEPEFKYVLITDFGLERVVKIDDVEFYLQNA